jgi:hypothetical protein
VFVNYYRDHFIEKPTDQVTPVSFRFTVFFNSRGPVVDSTGVVITEPNFGANVPDESGNTLSPNSWFIRAPLNIEVRNGEVVSGLP